METDKKIIKNSSSRKLIYIAIPIFLVVLIWFGWVLKDRVLPEPKVHYHAGFIVVKENRLVSFADTKFMKITPCTDENEHDEETPEVAQIEKAHLHENVGDVIHIEKAGSKWSDLFTNLNYPINYQYSTAYLNGEKINNFPNRIIKPYDSIVIFEENSNSSNQFLSQAVKKDHIVEEEKKSEDCGD